MTTHRSAIEGYPHIVDKLTRLWGSADLYAYLDGLVTTDRSAARAGFPIEVMTELFWLFEMHRSICPDHSDTGLWKHVSIYDEDRRH